MDKEDIWRLFTLTGNINYYLKYKSMEEGKIDVHGINKD